MIAADSEAILSGAHHNRTRWRAGLFPWVSTLYLTLMFGIPTTSVLYLLSKLGGSRLWITPAIPFFWALSFLMVAGTLSLPHRFSVIPGKFRRDLNDRLYFHRRLHGLCWATVYYNKPVYYLCLCIPFLKWITFRLF